MFSLDDVFPKETPRNCHRSLKWLWHPPNLLRSFRVYIKISNKVISKDALLRFSNSFMNMFLFTILAPQKPPKKSSQLLEKGVASDKFTFIV